VRVYKGGQQKSWTEIGMVPLPHLTHCGEEVFDSQDVGPCERYGRAGVQKIEKEIEVDGLVRIPWGRLAVGRPRRVQPRRGSVVVLKAKVAHSTWVGGKWRAQQGTACTPVGVRRR
jgi:hypothetical protein